MSEPISQNPAPEELRQQLRDLRRGLLHLHKALLDSEREVYEQAHGAVNSGELLQLVIGDEHFTWLHAISESIVRIDELLDADEPPASLEDARAMIEEVRNLLKPSESGSDFQRSYFIALQREPATVLSHREVMKVL